MKYKVYGILRNKETGKATGRRFVQARVSANSPEEALKKGNRLNATWNRTMHRGEHKAIAINVKPVSQRKRTTSVKPKYNNLFGSPKQYRFF